VTARPSASSRFVGADFALGIPQLMRSPRIPSAPPSASLLSKAAVLKKTPRFADNTAVRFHRLVTIAAVLPSRRRRLHFCGEARLWLRLAFEGWGGVFLDRIGGSHEVVS
jgi:hypothetical protein